MSTAQQHRPSVITYLKRSLFAGVAALLMLFAAAPIALADDDCSPVAPAPNGISQPTGADAGTYHYNSCTGLWENKYYTWSPATKEATPKMPYVYRCDTTSWQWEYKRWVYSPASQSFSQQLFSVEQLPNGAAVADDSLNPCASPPANTGPSQPADTNTGSSSSQPSDASSSSNVSGQPGQSGQTKARPDGSNVVLDSQGNVTVGNQIGSSALTGDASANADTTTGDATSGNANATANVINTVNSATTFGNNVVGFTANINGDVQGDLVVDPSQIQPASDSKPLTATDVTIHSKQSGTIDNNIDVNAQSGTAAATDNTKAGNVTSGSASAVADVMNVLNSIVSAGKSFVGVININGNLHGNILVPQNFLSQLLATNAPHTTMTISAADATNLGISNTVNNSATTGSATASSNTQSGDVASGSSATKVTIFNLTGAKLVGSNCMLVFVNVSGSWVGVIMNAPAGATAAAIGDASSNFSSSASDAIVAAPETNNVINNDISVAAASGDATATGNTGVGNVKSGNADTAVNLLNLNNTQLNLSGWFGVLFINVFGNWYGNFGVYTPPAATHTTTSATGPKPEHTAAPSQSFHFVPRSEADTAATDPAPTMGTSDPTVALISAQMGNGVGNVLGDRLKSDLRPTAVVTHATITHDINPVQLAGGVLMAAGISTLVIERLVTSRRQQASK